MIPTILRRVKLAKLYAKSYLLYTIIFFYIFFPTIVAAQTPPYPPSSFVEMTFDFSSHIQHGVWGDQWPMTWADDGHVYGKWGDGVGWNNGLPHKAGESFFMGVTRIQGEPPNLSGTDIWGLVSPGPTNYKPSGFVADANRKMYLFRAMEPDRWKSSSGGISTDNGRTWNFNQPKVFDLNTDGVVVVGIAQFGPGYTGVPSSLDNRYFYVYLSNSHMNESHLNKKGQDVYLGRVPRADIFKRSAYTYFSGLDGNSNPIWSSNWSSKKPVFHDPEGMEFHVMVNYNPELGRYIYSKGHNVSGLGVFESPNPWGPWETIYYDRFKDSHWKFTYQFPQKWMSSDGKTMWMAWSGWPEYSNVNFIKTTLKLKQPSVDTTPPARPMGLKLQ